MSLAEIKSRVQQGLLGMGCSPPTEEHPGVGLFFPLSMLLAEELYNGAIEEPPVQSFHDPRSVLPSNPSLGDRYIASHTGNFWTAKNIYEWLGQPAGWSEIPYREGRIVYVVAMNEWFGAGDEGWRPLGGEFHPGGTVQEYVKGDGSLGNFQQSARWSLTGEGPIDYDPALGRIGFDVGWSDARYAPQHGHPYLSDSDARVAHWDAAFGWGNHALAGYAPAHDHPYAPLSHVGDASHISGAERTNWNAAYTHSQSAHNYLLVTDARIANWDAAYGWGNHAGLYSLLGHVHATLTRGTGLTGNNYTGASATTWAVAYGTTSTTACVGNDSRVLNGQTAFGWGNHALAGYAPAHDHPYAPLSHVGDASHISGAERTNWNAAYTHSQSAHNYLLATDARIANWDAAYGWGNHAGLYSLLGHVHATLTRGTGLTGNNYTGASATTWAVAYGTTSTTACVGNDSRVLNGQTAFGWGNHALAGYAPAHDHPYAPLSHVGDASHISGAERTNWNAAYTHSQSAHNYLLATDARIANWDAAYGWGNHAGLYSLLGHVHATLTRGTGLTGNNYTGASATTWAVAYGTTSTTACVGNDTRLSNERTPINNSYYVQGTSARRSTDMLSADLNEYNQSGFWRADAAAPNNFLGVIAIGMHAANPNSMGFAWQIIKSASDDDDWWIRYKNATTWRAPVKLWHTGNFTPAEKVTGPTSVTNNRIAVFDGTTGKLLKQGERLESELARRQAMGSGFVYEAGLDFNLLNTTLEPRFLRPDAVNAPANWNGGYYIGLCGGDVANRSFVLAANRNATQDISVRLDNGTWRKFYHDGNFNPANYSLTTHHHDTQYLQLIGGTLTGNLGIGTVGTPRGLTVTGNSHVNGSIRANDYEFWDGRPDTWDLATLNHQNFFSLPLINGMIQPAGMPAGAWTLRQTTWANFKAKLGITPADIGAPALIHYHDDRYPLRASGTSSDSSIRSMDTRNSNFNFSDRGAGFYADFKANAADNLTDGGTFHGVLTFRPYGNTTDLTGGPAYQLGFTENTNVWVRKSTGTTTWGSWVALSTNGHDHDARYLRHDANNSANLAFAAADGRGIRFWGDQLYSIYMSISSNATFGGTNLNGAGTTYNTYFTQASDTGWGWVFKCGVNPVIQLDGNGRGTFKNTVIGPWIHDGALAMFGHTSVRGDSGAYALLQDGTGTTYLNAASSKAVNFRIGNIQKLALWGDRLDTTVPVNITGSHSLFVGGGVTVAGNGTGFLKAFRHVFDVEYGNEINAQNGYLNFYSAGNYVASFGWDGELNLGYGLHINYNQGLSIADSASKINRIRKFTGTLDANGQVVISLGSGIGLKSTVLAAKIQNSSLTYNALGRYCVANISGDTLSLSGHPDVAPITFNGRPYIVWVLEIP